MYIQAHMPPCLPTFLPAQLHTCRKLHITLPKSRLELQPHRAGKFPQDFEIEGNLVKGLTAAWRGDLGDVGLWGFRFRVGT